MNKIIFLMIALSGTAFGQTKVNHGGNVSHDTGGAVLAETAFADFKTDLNCVLDQITNADLKKLIDDAVKSYKIKFSVYPISDRIAESNGIRRDFMIFFDKAEKEIVVSSGHYIEDKVKLFYTFIDMIVTQAREKELSANEQLELITAINQAKIN